MISLLGFRHGLSNVQGIHRAWSEDSPVEGLQQVQSFFWIHLQSNLHLEVQDRAPNRHAPYRSWQGNQCLCYLRQTRCVFKTAKMTETEIVDIYLLPPNEDPEQCSSWLRMRSRDGRYSLMFEEWMTEVPYIISPRVTFEVSARILGGLMALGYEIGPILKRKSIVHSDGVLSVKQDTIEKLGTHPLDYLYQSLYQKSFSGKFTQIHGNDRAKVREAAMKLGLEGSYIPRSYIEQV